MGPEGSGKSTVAEKISNTKHIPYITLGNEIRRRALDDKGKIGDICRDAMANHTYIDPDVILQLAEIRLSQDDVLHGFILDGAGRATKEILLFRDFFARRFPQFPVTMIHLRIPGWESDWRLRSGPRARGRNDDSLVGILARLTNFYSGLAERTATIRNKTSWRFMHVIAMDTPENVAKKVLYALP